MSASLITLLLLNVRIWHVGRALSHSGYYGYRLEALDNLIFNDNPVFQSSHPKTPGACALTCASHLTCLAFTFISSSGLYMCRGHSAFSSLNPSLSTAAADAQTWVFGCPQADNYLRVSPSRCLRLYRNGKPHTEAESRCRQDGGGLFMMKTWDDNALLGAFLAAQGLPFNWVWLGGKQQPGEGQWVWRDGSILPLSSSLWLPGNPDNMNGNQDCLHVWASRNDDAKCMELKPFVCEIP